MNLCNIRELVWFFNEATKKILYASAGLRAIQNTPEMQRFIDESYFGNTVYDYFIALVILALGTTAILILRKVVINKLRRISERTEGKTDDLIVANIDRFGIAAFQFGVLYWAITSLILTDKVARVVEIAASVVVTYFILRLLSAIILYLLQNRIRRQERGEEKIRQLGGLMLIINFIIWIIGLVFLFDNLGYNVTTIITGLGIGGIAVALAAQNILGDLFNYFVIFFDRPFEAGDFIVVDDKMGTVEYVGIKTTRIRSLSGEQIIMGNSNITGSRIHNFKRLNTRRVVFSFHVDYETPADKLRIIPEMIKLIILEEQPMTRFDRAHLANFGDWGLRYEVVYFVDTPDFNLHMDIQQKIYLKVIDALAGQEVSFAMVTKRFFEEEPRRFSGDRTPINQRP